MKLKTKVIGVLLAVLLVYGVLSYGIERFVVFPSFVLQERLEAEKDLNRCLEALRREIHYLDAFVHDWAAWDDAYEFIQDVNTDFITSNLVLPTFIDNRLNVIMFLDMKGCILWKKILDLETRSELDIAQFARDCFPLSHAFMDQTKDVESTVAGVYATDKGPLLVASRPIIRSLHQGPAKGYLVMGRFLDTAYMKTLAGQTKVNHRYWMLRDPSSPAEFKTIFERLQTNSDPVFVEQDKNRLFVYGIFEGLTDGSAMVIQAEIPRQIMKHAGNTMFFVLVFTVFAGFVLLVVMYFLLNHVVIDPLGKLTEEVVSLGDSRQTSFSLSLNRNDEIGILCGAFQTLFNKLAQVHKNLQKTNTRLRHLTYKLLLTEERERRGLASDLHDQISQNLSICHLKLTMLRESGQAVNSALTAELEEIEDKLEEIIQETRTLTFEISPPVLYELGLKPALEWLLENTCEANGIDISIEGDLKRSCQDNSLNILIFRTVREVLLNIIKHAKAQKASVRLSPKEHFLEIRVIDDGIGFDPEKQHKNIGFGLFSIRERFRSIGGEFLVLSEPGVGTEAILKVPYELKDNAF